VLVLRERFQQDIEIAHSTQAVRQWLKLLAQTVNTLFPERWRRLQQVRHRAQAPRGYPHLVDIFDIAMLADRPNEFANPCELLLQRFPPDLRERLSAERNALRWRHTVSVAI
jgi:hypothetical protein